MKPNTCQQFGCAGLPCKHYKYIPIKPYYECVYPALVCCECNKTKEIMVRTVINNKEVAFCKECFVLNVKNGVF